MRRETFRNFIFESLVGSLESAGLFCVSGEKKEKIGEEKSKNRENDAERRTFVHHRETV